MLQGNAPFDGVVFGQCPHVICVENVGEENLIGPRQQTVWHVAGFFEIARAPKPLHLAHLFRAIVVELDYFGNFRRPTIFRTKAKVIPQLECNVRPPPTSSSLCF